MRREQGHHQNPGPDPGNNQVMDGVDGHNLQGVDLLGDPHGPQFGGDGRPGPGIDHQAGHHRPHFPGHGKGHDPAHEAFPAELAKAVVALQGQNHAGKQPGQDHDKEGFHPDEFHLLDQVAQAEGGAEGQPGGLKEHDQNPSQFPDKPYNRVTDIIKKALDHMIWEYRISGK